MSESVATFYAPKEHTQTLMTGSAPTLDIGSFYDTNHRKKDHEPTRENKQRTADVLKHVATLVLMGFKGESSAVAAPCAFAMVSFSRACTNMQRVYY